MIFLTLLTALGLSGIAAYYSVIGLAQIFPGSFWAVIIMGSILEASKLVTVSWLYRNWKECPVLIRTYLSIAVVILMLITSMGIFGFLSKAHLEHSADNAPLVDRIALLDEKIKTEKENVEANRKTIKQYDEFVDQTLGRSTDEKGADKAQAIRRSQQKDRSRILQEIEQSQITIAKYSEERAPLSTELKKIEADIGPIKYIAALAYGTEADGELIDKAVRLVILLIIIVFDPLAILLLIAYNMSVKEKQGFDDVENFFKRARGNAQKLDEESKQGFVAQEVSSVIPEAVTESETVSVNSELVMANMVKAFQELNEKVDNRVEQVKQDIVEIKKDNMIVIDDATGETIPPISHEKVEVHVAPGLHEEHHVPVKTLEPKYDYEEPYSFKEREVRDAGKF
jgi:hypothetical protein